MLDPATIGAAVSVASSAFKVLQKGFAAGRELEQMTQDLSRWMSAVSDVDHLEKSAKNPSLWLKLTKGKSIESLALEAFTAKKTLEDQRYQLKMAIQLTRGVAAWNELIALEGKIRKQRQEAIYAAQQRRQKIIEYIAWTITIGACLAILIGFVMLLKSHTAQAEPEYVTCRKAACEYVFDQKVCLYLGANNTQESMTFMPGEYTPSEYQCKYNPNKKKPLTLRETLDAIKEALQ